MPIKTQATLTILTLMTATLLITVMDLDRETARLFYAEGSGFASGDRLLWRTLYRYGEWPALLLAGGALLGLIAGFFRAGLRRHRRVHRIHARVIAHSCDRPVVQVIVGCKATALRARQAGLCRAAFVAIATKPGMVRGNICAI